ncbi:MAG: nucleoside-triphosphatase [Proteobacteria bacterium]|nr:hypothetical protein [Desulfobacteraceae bacterium]MBU3980394.1 nucleoside-triphosphatase [Pseudomonadota bacterium]MBU4012976.1 nucleoside-triphosphatase [Pseudomonadota bacterium]MBU4067142.1 nucleoside-triphosphatase [Pseudomonadota bacterium]MBU4101701.1 nucleoside-triphosphatase [Pseudomonadota bacterium]
MFFLTGPPSSGKTTIIKKVIKKLGLPASGFYTEEERVSGKRLGFLMKTPLLFPYMRKMMIWYLLAAVIGITHGETHCTEGAIIKRR